MKSWQESPSNIQWGEASDPLRKEHIEMAAQQLKPLLNPTSLIQSAHFSNLTGLEVWLKPENMQQTGSYKVRGAAFRISQLTDEEKAHPLIAASAGNHAQGVALAAHKAKLKAYIVMPETTPLVKVNRTKSLGAEVILHGERFDDAFAHATALSKDNGYTFIHPFNDLEVAAGQGSVGVEILHDLPNVDVVLVPIGGGGLAAGLASYIKQVNPQTKVLGVEPIGAASAKAALAAGEPIAIEQVNTIADGTAVQKTGSLVYPYLAHYLDDILTVQDEDLVPAFLDLMEAHKMIAENAGLLTIAALPQLRSNPDLQIAAGSKVCAILSGGNMDVITMSSLVQHGLRARNRIFTFSVLLPDRPGELERIAHITAKMRGNIISLEHNQFININRTNSVELRVTLEAFGSEHKAAIMQELYAQGYRATVVGSNS